MKITFILPGVSLSGGTKVVLVYAQELAKLGHTVVLISPPPPKPSILGRLRLLGSGERAVAESRIAYFFPEGACLDYRSIDRRRPIVDRDVPDGDVVIATWWETAEWVNSLSSSKGEKVYFVQGHEIFSYLPIERCRATYRMPLRKIVVANWLKNLMHESYGDDDVVVVPNSVDHSKFFSTDRVKQTVPTIGTLYATAPTKGLSTSRAAIRLLRERVPGARVLYFGSESPAKSMRFEVGETFHHRPPQDKIREIYSTCDVWLTASINEGFNLTAMEAMACGTPIVSTRTGWPIESIVPYENGILTSIDDVPALASGLEWVLTRDQSQWSALSKAASKTVEASSWRKSATLFEAALVGFLKKPNLSALPNVADATN